MRGRNPSADSGAGPGWGWRPHPQLSESETKSEDEPGTAKSRQIPGVWGQRPQVRQVSFLFGRRRPNNGCSSTSDP